ATAGHVAAADGCYDCRRALHPIEGRRRGVL
ncbi:uncharacterized protein METZ01_LOCUS463461, partial [marine metagenome]